MNKRKHFFPPTALIKVYQAINGEDLQMHRAAKEYNVPLTTLRVSVDNIVNIDCTKTDSKLFLRRRDQTS